MVSYNGVTLPYAQINRFDQKAVADDSGTDLMVTQFDIQVSCVLNADYLTLIAPDLAPSGVVATSNPAAIMDVIRARLMRRKRRLSITINGVDVIPATQSGLPANSSVDAANGPIPQSCEISQLTDVTFLCLYRITASYWETPLPVDSNINPDGSINVANAGGNDVLSNRWSESQQITNNFVRRTRSGKVVIRSDNFGGRLIDQLRNTMAVTGLPRGFLRVSSTYTVDPNGLAMRYDIVDQEVWRMPPQPAFEADGYYLESTTMQGGWRIGEGHISLKGDKLTKQTDLINVAIQVITGKLMNRQDDGLGNWVILDNASLKQGLYTNTVEFTMRVKKGGTFLSVPGTQAINAVELEAAINAFGNLDAKLDQPPDINYTPPYLSYGTGNILLQAAAYYDPSLTNTSLNQKVNQLTTGRLVGTLGQRPEG